MNYISSDIERIAKEITRDIEAELEKAGIFYRIFYRCKDDRSLSRKLNTLIGGELKYNERDKLIRDIIGIRINLYFLDDLEIFRNYYKKKFQKDFVEETIDENTTTEFKPTRINTIFKIPSKFGIEFREVIGDLRIDATYELQLRTMFSEGWHEVEHDLRYKCQEDWNRYPQMARTFNGILASLETHDWAIIQIFNSLAYSHYTQSEITALVRTKFRLRFTHFEINAALREVVNSAEFSKELFKANREDVLNLLLLNTIPFPLSTENVIFFINHFLITNEEVSKLTPNILLKDFQSLSHKVR